MAVDQATPGYRSWVMSQIKDRGTAPELAVINALSSRGADFVTHVADLPGKPDVVFRKERLVIFIDGCFWHGCRRHCRIPRTNSSYWRAKIERNQVRGRRYDRKLRRDGWRVFHFWEHDITIDGGTWLRRLSKAVCL